MFGFVIAIVALVLIGVGIAMGLVAAALAAALVGLGVVSSSVLVGLLAGRSRPGIRVFFLQCGVLAGIPAGALCAWVLHHFSDVIGAGWVVPAYGAAGGALAGLCIALMLDFISHRLHAWAGARLRLKS